MLLTTNVRSVRSTSSAALECAHTWWQINSKRIKPISENLVELFQEANQQPLDLITHHSYKRRDRCLTQTFGGTITCPSATHASSNTELAIGSTFLRCAVVAEGWHSAERSSFTSAQAPSWSSPEIFNCIVNRSRSARSSGSV